MIYKKIIIFIGILLINNIIVDGIIFENKDILKEKPANFPPSTGGSSHVIATTSTETTQVNTTTEIISPQRDEGFFNGSAEVITVLTKVTPLSKNGLKNLEIWVVPSNGLKIENCTYPLRTSNIMDLLDYIVSDKSVIKYTDINDIIFIKKRLNITNPNSLYSRIYYLLNDTTKRLLDRTDSEKDGKLCTEILKDFNIIINNPTDQDLNISHFAGSNVTPRSSIHLADIDKGLYQGFNNNSDSFLSMNDFRLFKRRLLEDAFPESIKRVPYYKDHEDYKLDNSNRIMIGKKEIGESYLRCGESIIFKYYLHPNELGRAEIHSIIRAEGFYREEKTNINIIEREPRFEVSYKCPSKEIVKNVPMEFEYYIKYVGGDEEEKAFNISFNPVINKATNRPFRICNVTPPEISGWVFRRGKTENFSVSATYNQEGYRLSPPTVSINGKEEKFESDLSVYESDNMYARLHYDSIALKYQNISNIIAIILALLTFISIFILVGELLLIDKELKISEQQRTISDEIFTKLDATLNKILNGKK
jgi:hypothetical protein